MVTVVAVDAEGAVRDWCTALGMRAALQPQRSGPNHLLLSRAGGLQEPAGRDTARVTALAHGKTKQEAANLALQFANEVWSFTSGPIADGVWCTDADVDSGPTEVTDTSGISRYLVVATFYLGPIR